MTKSDSVWGYIIVATIFFYTSCQPPKTTTSDLLQWVPQNTTSVIQINDINEWENVRTNHPLGKKIPSLAPSIKASLNSFPTPNNDPFLLCLTPIGKNKKALTMVYKSSIDSSYLSREEIDYSGQKVFVTKNNDHTLFTTFLNGYTLHCDTKIILENCIRNFRLSTNGITSDDFHQTTKTADHKAMANVHIQGHSEKGLAQWLGEMPLFPKIGQQWTSLDIDFTPKGVTIDGLVKIADSLGDPLSVIKKISPKKLIIEQALPQSFQSFMAFPIDNHLDLEDQFKRWIRYHNYPLRNTELTVLTSIDELALVKMGNGNGMILHSQDEIQAKATFLTSETEKTYRGVHYSTQKTPKALEAFAGILGHQMDIEWGAIIEDFVFLATNEATLKSLIAAYKEERTLVQSKDYQDFKTEMLFESISLQWVTQTSYLKKQTPQHPLWENFETSDYPFLAFQGIVESDYLHQHYRLFEQRSEFPTKSTQEAALFTLDQPLANAPQWLKNHRSKQKDIAVQDQTNVLYLFSNTGKLFWKKQLSGPIVGEIQQVDLYKNGRLQMAFRTADHFYILDRNGKIVPPFDMKIKNTEPVMPLAVFDYDLRRDYRFVLAQGKELRMLDGKGKNVNGFSFRKTKANLAHAPKHFRISNKDYISVQEENGALHLLSRTGKPRVKIKEKIAYSPQEIYAYLKTFTTTDQSGNLVQIDPSGNVIKTPLDLTKGHAITATTKSLVTLSNNILTIKGLPISLPFGEYTPPQIFYLNNTIYVGVTDQASNKVHLFYSNGKTVPGFPVYGNSVIDLSNADKDKAIEMVVQTSEKDISIYKIKD